MCSFFVELPSIICKPCQLVNESLLGHTLVQSNKYHSSPTIALVSVRHRGPSAREANPNRGGWPNTRDNRKLAPNVGPMAGGRDISTAVTSESAARWPTANLYKNRFISVK